MRSLGNLKKQHKNFPSEPYPAFWTLYLPFFFFFFAQNWKSFTDKAFQMRTSDSVTSCPKLSKYFLVRKTRGAHHDWQFCQKLLDCGWSGSSSGGCGTATCTPLWQCAVQRRWHARCQDSAESAGAGDGSEGPGLGPGPTARSWNWWGGWTRKPHWQYPWHNIRTREFRVKELAVHAWSSIGDPLNSLTDGSWHPMSVAPLKLQFSLCAKVINRVSHSVPRSWEDTLSLTNSVYFTLGR